MKEKTILSGMRPTGAMHIGNYFGALKNWIDLQRDFNCFYFVADWHALTTGYEDTSGIKENINNLVIDWLSCGLNPSESTIFLQSRVKQHSELNLLFSMITPLSWLTRCPTYKEQLAQIKDKNISTHGFLGYPCLQAVDILLYKPDFVPVGEDQLPHLELTREIARRFNFLYGATFPEPASMLTKSKVLPGTDGRKMSKSYNNTIAFSDSPEIVKKKVSGMITDPERIKRDDPGHPDVCSVYAFHKVFSEDEIDNIRSACEKGEIGCVQCKKNLAAKMDLYLTPIYEKRQEYVSRPDYIWDVLNEGSAKAILIAEKTMEEVRINMKIDY